jgi:hypothetical protein
MMEKGGVGEEDSMRKRGSISWKSMKDQALDIVVEYGVDIVNKIVNYSAVV